MLWVQNIHFKSSIFNLPKINRNYNIKIKFPKWEIIYIFVKKVESNR